MVDFRSNAQVGWFSFVLGVGSGAIMGLWSFDGPFAVPSWLGEYNDLGRRLVRLGHIAFFGLGILNVLLGRELPGLALGLPARQMASRAMNLGNLLLPLALFVAAVYPSFKYFLPVPVTCVFLALAIVAYGKCCPGKGNSDANP